LREFWISSVLIDKTFLKKGCRFRQNNYLQIKVSAPIDFLYPFTCPDSLFKLTPIFLTGVKPLLISFLSRGCSSDSGDFICKCFTFKENQNFSFWRYIFGEGGKGFLYPISPRLSLAHEPVQLHLLRPFAQVTPFECLRFCS